MDGTGSSPKDLLPIYSQDKIMFDIEYERMMNREVYKETPEIENYNVKYVDDSNISTFLVSKDKVAKRLSCERITYELREDDDIDCFHLITPERCLVKARREEKQERKREKNAQKKQNRSKRR